MLLHLCEIAPGIVAFMDSETLMKFGASCLRPHSDCFKGLHPLVCVEAGRAESIWVVLSSKNTSNRTLWVPASCKRGHSSWTSRDSFVYGRDHVWRGPNMAFQEASSVERSTPAMRNSVTTEILEQIRQSVNPFGCAFGRTG